MTIEYMREQLKLRYPNSPAWAARLSRMADTQVYAMYMRIFTRR